MGGPREDLRRRIVRACETHAAVIRNWRSVCGVRTISSSVMPERAGADTLRHDEPNHAIAMQVGGAEGKPSQAMTCVSAAVDGINEGEFPGPSPRDECERSR